MSNGEKDKLGDKLHDVEAARENEWARKRDQELLEKMRQAAKGNQAAAKPQAEPAVCPECKQALVPNLDGQVGGLICPQRHGGWFGWDAVARIMDEFARTKK
jgi:hypothetical protein